MINARTFTLASREWSLVYFTKLKWFTDVSNRLYDKYNGLS